MRVQMQAAKKAKKQQQKKNLRFLGGLFHRTLIHQKLFLLSEQLLPSCRWLHLCETRLCEFYPGYWTKKRKRKNWQSQARSLLAMNCCELISGSRWAGGAWAPQLEGMTGGDFNQRGRVAATSGSDTGVRRGQKVGVCAETDKQATCQYSSG